jgi:predicted dithiol-disulfide oxidoreductase (DUF899 family)
MTTPNLISHPVVTRDRWLAQRKALLAQEKELTQARDRVAEARRALPWVKLERDYMFDTTQGPRRLSELFQGKRQLLVQHFMLGPGWEQGCKSCSFMADHLDGIAIHLAQRDIAWLAVSRAPLAEIQRFRERMGWKFNWVSSHGNDFNRDFHVSFSPEELARGEVFYNFHMTPFPQQEAPGVSCFWRDDDGQVFHTYSTFGRGVEVMMGAYQLIDLTPKGRDEQDMAYGMAWVRHHDRYDDAAAPAASCCSGPAKA